MSGLPGWLADLGNTGNGLFVVDRSQRILTWNKAAEELLGYAAREVVGKPCHTIIGAEDRTEEPCCGPCCGVLRSVDAGCPVEDFDVRVRTRSGSDVWLTFSVLVIAIPGNPLTVHLFHPVRHRDHAMRVRPTGSGRPMTPLAGLSLREQAILQHLVHGRTTTEIADHLGISPLTVRTHVRNMLGKAKVRSRVQLVSLAVRAGFA